MFDLKSKRVLRRVQGWLTYFGTLSILFSFGLMGTGVIYAILCFTQIAADQHTQDDAELIAAFTFDEKSLIKDQGFQVEDYVRLDQWDVLEILKMVIDSPKLPKSYPCLKKYSKLLDLERPLMLNSFSSDEDEVSVLRRRLLNSQVIVTDAFASAIENKVDTTLAKLDILTFESIAYNINTFAIESFIATGIYTYHRYDFELVLVNMEIFDCPFYEYTLIVNQNLNNNLVASASVSDTKTIIETVNSKLTGSRYRVHEFLSRAQRSEEDFKTENKKEY